VRPVVKTALRRVWRDASTVQIGVNPDRAVVLGGVGGKTADLMAAFDGTKDHQDLRLTARELGLDPRVADRLIGLLADASVIDDAATSPAALAHLDHAERDRLAPDLASISIVSGRPDAGISTMAVRQQAGVVVIGAGRVGAAIAALLSAAGVGRIAIDDPATCRPADCAPAGSALPDVGATRAQAARAAIHRVSASVRTSSPPSAGRSGADRFDIAVVAPSSALDPHVTEALVRAGTSHLIAQVRETTGVIGPLVVPGRTACLRCLDLHRSDRDPAWPLIAAQLATRGHRPSVQACDVALATLVASVAALQVLEEIDAAAGATTADATSRTPCATYNGTLEITLPDWRIRRRSWSPHPACGCHWPDGPCEAPDDL
jgi:bacteriocin biosynthesis cyclodehydratase domain-containing protein